MTETERTELLERIKRFNERIKDIKSDISYCLYVDEGGMVGIPSFFLIRQNSIKMKAPAHHCYQCLANGSFIKGYIDRLLYIWRTSNKSDYLETFRIKVIN